MCGHPGTKLVDAISLGLLCEVVVAVQADWGDGFDPENMTAQQELGFRRLNDSKGCENSWKIWPRDGEEEVIGCPSETGMIRNPPCLSGVIF